MRQADWHDRFFKTTRGRVLRLLCGSQRTVSELAELLGRTDNAVRSHLAALERDGLVYQSGLRRGTRKPNFAYNLTPAGHHFFPEAHGLVLGELLSVIRDAMSASEVEGLLHGVASRLVAEHCPEMKSLNPEQRVARLAEMLQESGLLGKLEKTEDRVVVEGSSCPLSQVVLAHPEICRIAASALSNLLGYPVSACCERSESSRCRFAIATGTQAASENADGG
jgi:predicted ArsR family transcriptional regulator